jgi:threonine dehydrogenase-like Zn-dependent dehydrogenase
MKAIVFRGAFNIAVEERPRPVLQDATDAIVRVQMAGICGR